MVNAIFLGLIAVGFVAAQLRSSGIKIQPIALLLGCIGLAASQFASVPYLGWIVGASAVLAFAGLSWSPATLCARGAVSAACFGFASVCHAVASKDSLPYFVAAVAGATFASGAVKIAKRDLATSLWIVPTCAAILAPVQILATAADGAQAAMIGPWVAALIAVLGLIMTYVGGTDGKQHSWAPFAVGILVGAAAFGVVGKVGGQSDLALAVLAASVVAGIAVWTSSDFARSALPIGASAACALVLANWAFSSGRGQGIALVGLVTVGIALVSASPRVAMAFVGVSALAWFRVVRYVLPDATTAFDAGNHYAALGFVVAILGVMAAFDVLRQRPKPIAALLVGLAGLAAIPLLTLYLGMKGAIGLALGLGLAPVVIALAGSGTIAAMPVGLGAVAFMIASVPWIQPALEGDRDIRVRWMLVLGALSAILFLGASIGGPAPRAQAAEGAE